MNLTRKTSVLFFLALAFTAMQFNGTDALAYSSLYSSNCASCHASPVTTSCNGCHHHGARNLKGTTNKTAYAPGESVAVTITGGNQNGWIQAILYNEKNQQVAVSSGNASGMGQSTTFPAVLTAPAPTTPGTYTWKAAWFGNSFDTNNMNANSHGEEAVNTNSFTVTAPADTTAPVIGAFTLTATATSLNVPVSALSASDNVAVTGYLITTSSAQPAASASGWSASAPGSVVAVEGSNTFYAWARDAAGNVSATKSATVVVTLAVNNPPELTVSTLADGVYTNQDTINVSGTASDADGILSLTVNGQEVAVNNDGSFSVALPLLEGLNSITVVATDITGSQQSDTRTVNYDPTAPVITVTGPADNSNTTESIVVVSGSVNETSTVFVKVNNDSPLAANLVGNGFTATAYLAPGVNNIEIDATDLAGNTSSAKRTVNYDVAQMTLAVTDPAQDLTTSNSTLVLQGTVAALAGDVSVTVTMDDQTYTPVVQDGVFRQELTFTAARQYAIAVTATDAAGDTSTVYRNVIYNPTRQDDDHEEDDHEDDNYRNRDKRKDDWRGDRNRNRYHYRSDND